MRLLLTAVPLIAFSSCASGETANEDDVLVFAAASLVDAFTDIANAYEAEKPGSNVDLNFASSSDLATQIIEGAPAEVFASADIENIAELRENAVAIGDETIFATNSLEILVESGNPLGIRNLSDLSNPSLVFVTCDESVPIGRYSAQVLSKANVDVTPKSFEENVKGIVNKVVLGEADAGIVYRTDVLAAGPRALGIAIQEEFNVQVSYPITTISSSPSIEARAFVDFVTSSDIARDILRSYGFGTP